MTWTCEAFGIPDVEYAWLKNSKRIFDWKSQQGGYLSPNNCGRKMRQQDRQRQQYLSSRQNTNKPGIAIEQGDQYKIRGGNVLEIVGVRYLSSCSFLLLTNKP